MNDLEKIRKFFFQAMLHGWASGGSKFQIPSLPGFKAIEYTNGTLRLLDVWSKTPESNKSSGMTTIFFENNPVWIMHYGGLYEKKASRLVKVALAEAYQKSEFFGGRGPMCVFSDVHKFFYFNAVAINDFERFKGREEVIDYDRQVLGWHDYWGMSLI
jgi:hypothetical protein